MMPDYYIISLKLDVARGTVYFSTGYCICIVYVLCCVVLYCIVMYCIVFIYYQR